MVIPPETEVAVRPRWFCDFPAGDHEGPELGVVTKLLHRFPLWFTTILVLIFATAGCHKPGLERSNLEDWEVREYPALGLRVEVPIDCFSCEGGSPSQLAISLHPYWPPRLLLAEPRAILEVRFRRRHITEIEQEQAMTSLAEDEKFWQWMDARHDSIGRFDDGGQILYRYDIQCQDDWILKTTVVLERVDGNDSPELEKVDDEAIRRILASAQCIE